MTSEVNGTGMVRLWGGTAEACGSGDQMRAGPLRAAGCRGATLCLGAKAARRTSPHEHLRSLHARANRCGERIRRARTGRSWPQSLKLTMPTGRSFSCGPSATILWLPSGGIIFTLGGSNFTQSAVRLEERIVAIRASRGAGHIVDLTLARRVVLHHAGRTLDSSSLGKGFRAVRCRVATDMPDVAEKQFLDLRDTAVTRLALAGCTVPEIRAIGEATGREKGYCSRRPLRCIMQRADPATGDSP